MPVRAGRRRHGRGLPGVRHPRHRRQRQLLQRHRRRRRSIPTPVLGIVGLIEDIRKAVRPGFRAAGDAVVLLGESRRNWAARSISGSSTAARPGPRPPSTSSRKSAVQECLPRARSTPGSSAPPTTSPKAAWPSPWPNAPSSPTEARLPDRPRGRPPRRRPPLRGIAIAHRHDLPPGEPRTRCWSWPRPGACRPGRSAASAATALRSAGRAGRSCASRSRRGLRAWKDACRASSRSGPRGDHGRGRLPQPAQEGAHRRLPLRPGLELHGHPRGRRAGRIDAEIALVLSNKADAPGLPTPANGASRRSSSTPSSSPRARNTTGRSSARSRGGGSTSSAWPAI